MDKLNHLEWLIRTDKIYTGDNLIAEAYKGPKIHRQVAAANYGDLFILDALEANFSSNYPLIKFLHEVIQRRDRGELSLEEAMKELGIKSKSTYYRRVKELKETFGPFC